MVVGGWTIQEPVSAENKAVLETALNGLVGCKYEPLVVAFQVVNGMKYIFIAKSTLVTPDPKIGLAKIYVTAIPAGQEPTLINIEPIV